MAAASVALPIAGCPGATDIDLTGTTASADVDFAKGAAKVTFAVRRCSGSAGELIAVDGKIYFKTTITGPLYQETTSGGPRSTRRGRRMIDNLGDSCSRRASS